MAPPTSDGKESACNAGKPGSIPRLGRSSGEGNGNPLQYSCLEIPMKRGAWWATVYGIAKSRTHLGDFFLKTCLSRNSTKPLPRFHPRSVLAPPTCLTSSLAPPLSRLRPRSVLAPLTCPSWSASPPKLSSAHHRSWVGRSGLETGPTQQTRRLARGPQEEMTPPLHVATPRPSLPTRSPGSRWTVGSW